MSMRMKSNKCGDVYRYLCKELLSVYGERESASLARNLLSHYLKLEISDLSLHFQDYLSESMLLKINFAKKKLLKHQPLQYIINTAHFLGNEFFVDDRVLIPRPETEELLLWASEYISDFSKPRIIDIGCGSACIAVSIAKMFPDAEVWALDISADALMIAEKNALLHDCTLNIRQIDIHNDTDYRDLPYFDFVISNPPYVLESERRLMSENVLAYEPANALFVPDADPILFYKSLRRFIQEKLLSTGLAFFEINEKMGEDLNVYFSSFGYGCEIREDINDKPRMIKVCLD